MPLFSKMDRYVLRELALAVLLTLVVLLLVGAGSIFIDMVSRVAKGKLPAALLFAQLGLRIIQALPLILPLATFMGMLLAFGRLYRDGEMAVMAAMGIGPGRTVRNVLLLLVPLALVIGATALVWSPAAKHKAKVMIDEANRNLLVSGLEAKRFIEIPGRDTVVYLADMSADGSEFQQLFVHTERDGRVDVVTAESGELFTESDGETRFLRLNQGFRVEGVLGQKDYRMMRFASNDIQIPEIENDTLARSESAMTTAQLLESNEPSHKAEWHHRLAAPLATLLLGLLAFPLAQQPPRQARGSRILIAALIYVLYSNGMSLGRMALAEGKLPAELGLWWLHALVAVGVLLLLWRQNRLPRPKKTAEPASKAVA